MMNKVTVAQAFEVAIATERAAERLFQGLEAKFAHHEDVATFWKQYALDEAKHAKWLDGLKARLTTEQLSRPVDASYRGTSASGCWILCGKSVAWREESGRCLSTGQ
jgi:hypothetical protein